MSKKSKVKPMDRAEPTIKLATITDQDPYANSLCHHFGVSDRQIREWIATAFAQMRRAIGETS
jgi:hypothetical protein